MKLKPLTREDCERARQWRNECLETLRTPYELTEKMQSGFYDSVICNRGSCHRYWGIYTTGPHGHLVGMCGITDIEWENSIGEISLIIDPKEARNGYGTKAVVAVLDRAFNRMGLKTVYGEVNGCNTNGIGFWKKIAQRYDGYTTTLPSRKFYYGTYHDSLYFSIDKERFNEYRD